MNNLKAKLKKEGGFTLIEMLIVVAIIAILVAISIPLVNQALERARESTDAANERSFKAVLLISFLNGKYETTGTPGNFAVNTVYMYDAANGTIVSGTSTPAAYGKSTKVRGVDPVDRKGKILCGKMQDDGTVLMGWYTAQPSATSFTSNVDLIAPELIKDT